MLNYMLKRIGLAILTLIIIIIATYLLVAIFSINPWANDTAFNNNIPKNSTLDKELAIVEARYSYNDPVILKLWKYISGLFHFNFGEIYLKQNRITSSHIPTMFFIPLKYTIGVTLPSFVISAIIGVLLGVWAGYKRGTWIDSVINSTSILFVALPSFIIAPIAIQIFAKFGFPSEALIPENGFTMSEVIKSYIPIILVVTLSSLVVYITYTRNMIITVLGSNYVLIAKSKGLSQSQIFFKYVLRNISIPLISIILPSYIGLLTGSIVIERYWRIPGTSQIIIDSFPTGEVNIVMFNIIFFTTLSLFTTIIVDFSYVVLDPRIRFSPASPRSFKKQFIAWIKRRKEIKNFERGVNEQAT